MIIALPFEGKLWDSTKKISFPFAIFYETEWNKIIPDRFLWHTLEHSVSWIPNYQLSFSGHVKVPYIYLFFTRTYIFYGGNLKYFGWHFVQMSFSHECLCFEGKGSSLKSIREISLNDRMESIWIFSGMSQITGIWVKHLDNVFIMQESFSGKHRHFKVIERFNSNA